MHKTISLIVISVLILAGIFVIYKTSPNEDEFIACTQDAMLCPDGSAVGRIPPTCEFALCPAEALCEGGECPTENTGTAGWKTFTDETKKVSFKYPESLTTEYIHANDWPLQVQILAEKFTCTEAGLENDRAGETKKRLVDNRLYCRTTINEGAAGSIYTEYAYAFEKNDGTAILTFTLRSVQCANYNDIEKTVCEDERETFDIDSVIDRIAQTLEIK